MTSPNRSTLIFVDPTVEDYYSLIQGARSDAEVIILNPKQDGIQQVSQALANRAEIESIHLVSHGSEASIQLGSGNLTIANLDAYAEPLQRWSTALADGADLLIYGCNVAAGTQGREFVQQLSQLTGADVAASDNLTGSADRGGDWVLEFAIGKIESPLAFCSEVLATYPGILQNFTVSDFNALSSAISTAADGDTITINGNISLTGTLPAITKTITFIGNNHTINGSGRQIFVVQGGAVSFANLTIANGKAVGGQGTDGVGAQQGGNGGLGAGGGLFIDGGNVVLSNVTFQNNQAVGGQGGQSDSGSGGTGGTGEGGAIFVKTGTLRLSNTSFSGNSAKGGLGGAGGTSAQNGVSGQGIGGAVYITPGATVTEENTASFSQNTATSSPNVFGQITDVVPPVVSSIAPSDSSTTTASPTVSYVVTFSQAVAGVDLTDFSFTADGNIIGAAVASVTGSGTTYNVVLNTGSGNGNLALVLNDDDSIKNKDGIPLGGTGAGNGDAVGNAYTINKTPATVQSITRTNSSLTAASTVSYNVRFSNAVTGVDAGDFALASTGITGASILSVKQVDTRNWQVQVNTGSGNGTLGLNLVDNDSILNAQGVPLGVLGGDGVVRAGDGSLTGETYTLDKTPPKVASIVITAPSPTKAASVSYEVTFDRPVTGVDKSDFALAASGVTGASIASVTQTNSGDSTTYTVVVNTGSGDGSLGLNVVDNDSIINILDATNNVLGVPLGGTGAGNGNFAGQSYTLLKSAPVVSGISPVNPNPNAGTSVNYAITFNQDVTGVDASDFAVLSVGVAGAGITSVTGSGKSYNVAVNTGNGNGSLGLSLVDNDSIHNIVNTPLGGTGSGNGNFTGQGYTINKNAPSVTSISRLESNPTNAANVDFTVIFNDNVVQVDPSDFALTTQGITGAKITSITRVNGSLYDVAVSTGSGDGTIGLNLVDNDSVLNSLGTPLGGAGTGNGNFTGEVYTVDRTSPTARIIDVSTPRQDKVDAIAIQFSEAVKGFDLSDLKLTRDGSSVNLFSRATLTTNDGITWTLGNTKKLTNQAGNYTLSLNAGDSGITDITGNPLTVNMSDRWTNLVTVDAFDIGITLRGTSGADQLTGTEDNDTLIGLAGNDYLLGLDGNDSLIGNQGNDTLDGGAARDSMQGGNGNDILIGGLGADTMQGGAGADRFAYIGNGQASALSQSLVDDPDRIQDFRAFQGDKFQLSFGNSLKKSNRPRGLFNAGKVKGGDLTAAVKAAYADKNQAESGSQALRSNEAVLLTWQKQTYLSVNDGNAGFSTAHDLVVNVTGIKLKSGDTSAGTLSVKNYFA